MATTFNNDKEHNMLAFTIVNGITVLSRDFEVHASGCKDLKRVPPTAPRWEVLAPSAQAAAESEPALAKIGTIHINDCCSPRRMAAAGRA